MRLSNYEFIGDMLKKAYPDRGIIVERKKPGQMAYKTRCYRFKDKPGSHSNILLMLIWFFEHTGKVVVSYKGEGGITHNKEFTEYDPCYEFIINQIPFQ